jgi:predicted membrane channel-forming protein YqfA (hemolysin III family)
MSAIIKQNFKLPLYLIRIASVNTCESLSNSIQMIRFLHGMQKSHDFPSIVDMVVCCLYEVGHIIYQHDSENRHLSLLRRLQKKNVASTLHFTQPMRCFFHLLVVGGAKLYFSSCLRRWTITSIFNVRHYCV